MASGPGLQETPRQLIACLNGNPLGIAISKFKGDKYAFNAMRFTNASMAWVAAEQTISA